MNLLDLDLRLDERERTCRAIVETPAGFRSKYDYDPESGLFELKGVLPEGMSFPADFGFVPATLGEDGDPLDVLVLSDEPAPVGTLAEVRLIGVIRGLQTEGEETDRNDRLVAVTPVSLRYGEVRELRELGDKVVDHWTQFWVNYNQLKGRTFEVEAVEDAQAAVRAVRDGLRPRADKQD